LQADKPMQRSTLAGNESYPNMVLISGGTFRMGSDKHYPAEAPVHRVTVDAFRIDKTPVTNRQFKEFVRATGHVTVAEMIPDQKDYPHALPHMLYAGSLVFSPPNHPVDLKNWGQWWTFLRGANWRRPYGPKSNINVLDSHPVVHVAYADALAPKNPRGALEQDSYDACQPHIKIPRKVLKGDSHLCAPNYCRRYRPAARRAEPIDTSTSHVGFRCVVRG
jgi:formylglycine-generating enzyme required for sulfatase activity